METEKDRLWPKRPQRRGEALASDRACFAAFFDPRLVRSIKDIQRVSLSCSAAGDYGSNTVGPVASDSPGHGQKTFQPASG